MLYTVYGLHEEGKPDEIQYVGMTGNKPEERLAGHLSKRNGNLPVNRWIGKVLAEHKQIVCRVFMQTECSDAAAQMEEYLIKYFAGLAGPLHNVESNPRPLEKALAAVGEALRVVQAKLESGEITIAALNAACGIDSGNHH